MTDALGFMAQHGARLIDNDWPIIPIMPGTKAPGRFTRERWEPMPEWQRHCDRPTKTFEVDIWRRWPGCAVGIACGTVVGIDIDITDAASATAVERLARARFGETPLLRIGQAPKRLLVYRAAEPFPSIQRANIQILARGRQFLAYAIHPVTARPYEWPDESPLDVDLASVPAVTFEAVQAFLEEAVAALPEELRVSRMPVAPTAVSGKGQRGTVPAIAAALEWIPNDDWHYDDWIGIGLAIKGALGDEGRDLWLSWSAKAPKDDPAVTARKWDREMRAPKAGAGTIYFHAQRYGWVPTADLILDGEAAELAVQPNPAQALIDRARTAAAAPQLAGPRQTGRDQVPPSLMAVDGLLADMVSGIVSTAVSPQPFLALGASLSAIGALMGRRYRAPSGLRSNLYTVGIADSGGGKDHARKWIKEALFAAGLSSYLGGSSIASGQAIMTSLRSHASRLYQLDEFGHFLAGVLSRRAPAHKMEIWAKLTELYTQADGWMQGTDYANQKDRPREDICQPTCCVHATTVPGPFWKALEGGSILDGSLARWLIFRTDQDYPPVCDEPPPITVSDAILAALRAVTAGAEGHDYGGNIAMLMSGDAAPVPYTVPYAPGAAEALRELKAQEREWLKQSQGSGTAAIIARYVENAIKVALIRAVSYDPARPAIRTVDVEWAAALVEHCIGTTLREAQAHIADNETEAKHKKVLAVIRQSGAAGISQSDLARRTQWLNGRERTDILTALVESGQVQAEAVVTSTKPARHYRSSEILQNLSVNSSVEVYPLTH